MPELPEVETIGRGLQAELAGRRLREVLVRRRDLRLPIPPDFAERVVGRRIESVRRRAKYLLLHLSEGASPDRTLIVAHLGMTGRFSVQAPPFSGLGTHDHVVFSTDDDRRTIFSDPRRFGVLCLGQADRLHEHPLLKDLGPEPLDPGWDGAQLLAKLATRTSPIKALLLDQSVVAGLGNIYVSEALFRARISPLRPGHRIQAAEASRLVRAAKAVLNDAIAAGGSTLRDYVQADGSIGGFQTLFSVYEQQGQRCRHRGCRGEIQRIVQAGRSTYFCPTCQR
jgi:formamidopyrimidine-DNA glycosylase